MKDKNKQESESNYAITPKVSPEDEAPVTGWRTALSYLNPTEHEEDILARAYAFILSWSDNKHDQSISEPNSTQSIIT
jgi:hypothetical protein